MPNTLLPLLQGIHLSFIFKIIVLIILGLFLIFTFVLLTQVRSLNNIVKIHAHHASRLIIFFEILYFLLAVALFASAIVIL